jgi:hypothetical protein
MNWPWEALNPDEIAQDSGKKILISVIVTIVTAGLSFFVGRYWGWYKARREWRNKEFLNRVIVSLNIFDQGTLKIRTVMERSLEEVFLNTIAIEKVLTAAKACTATQPMLPIAPEDRWYLLNFALNAIAEHFAPGQIRLDAGQPVVKVNYVVFLTCEVVGEERIRKIRAMMIRREHLESFPYPDTLPTLENPWHEDRIKTLRLAAQVYQQSPDQFLSLEVCV